VLLKIEALGNMRPVSERCAMHDRKERLDEDHHRIQTWRIAKGWLATGCTAPIGTMGTATISSLSLCILWGFVVPNTEGKNPVADADDLFLDLGVVALAVRAVSHEGSKGAHDDVEKSSIIGSPSEIRQVLVAIPQD